MGLKETLLMFLTIVIVSGYDTGIISKYSYVTTTLLDEQCLGENAANIVGHRLTATILLTAIWKSQKNASLKLIKLEVLEPKLFVPKKSSFVSRPSELDNYSTKASYILREEGSVLKIWDDPTEYHSVRNIKRGIVDLLQTQKKDQNVREVGVAGNCEVIYEVNGEHIKKRKGNCVHFHFDESLSQPNGVRSAATQHLSLTDCKLLDAKSDTLSVCSLKEYVKVHSNVWTKPSLCVNAESQFLLEGVSEEKEVYEGKDYESVIAELKSTNGNLEKSEFEAVLVSSQANKQNNLADSVKKYQDSLKATNLAKMKSALAFYKLLPQLRLASKEEITKVLQTKSLQSIQAQILDLVAASSTEDSLKAAFEYFQDVTGYDAKLERFLISLSVTPRPKEYVLREIKGFLEGKTRHEKIEATLYSTLGAILKTYGEHDNANDEVLKEYRTYLENKLSECNAEPCVKALLRALRNAALPRSVPLLLNYALKGGKSALEAILAVRNVDVRLLSVEIQHKLLNVFLQATSKQDRSTRAIAADILLDLHADDDVLKGILSSLSDQTDSEFTTFLTSKLLHKMSLDKQLRSRVLKLLPERHISYYYSLSQKGSSSLFTKPLINSDDVSVSYGIQMEMMAGGLMKRSVFDVMFEEPIPSNLLSVGMFGEGMSSLAGESSNEEEGVTPQAGMELTLLGSSLRPYIFFTGTSELMGHAWSGTASEPTPALQGIFSFSDDERIVVLNNGLVVQIQLRGVLSTDLSASVQISLWNRNSQSQVKNAAALLMRGSVTVDTGFAAVQGAFQFSGQSAIDFSTDLEFAESPFKMCLTMEHPAITVKYDSHRSINVSGTKYMLKRIKRRKREIPSRSYALHERNNEQCRELKSEF